VTSGSALSVTDCDKTKNNDYSCSHYGLDTR
jgi:hypothetical protein